MKLFPHRRRLYFLPGYLGLPPFHQDFQKAPCCLPGSQPFPPIFLLHGVQVAVHEVSVTRWQQGTTIIKIPDKKGSSWTKANQKQKPQILSEHSFWTYAQNYSNSVWKKKGKCKGLVAQPCSTLCEPMDCGLPGSSVHGINSLGKDWKNIYFTTLMRTAHDETPGGSSALAVGQWVGERVAGRQWSIWEGSQQLCPGSWAEECRAATGWEMDWAVSTGVG